MIRRVTPQDEAPSHRRQGRLFYGWVIVIVSFLVCVVAFGVQNSFGIFFKPLQQEFMWSAALTSGVFSLYMIVHGLFAIAAGWATDRFGPKMTIIGGSLFLRGGLVLTRHIYFPWE